MYARARSVEVAQMVNVPYRSTGLANRMAYQTLTTAASRAAGRIPQFQYAPPQRRTFQPIHGALNGLGCCASCADQGADVSYDAAKSMGLGALGATNPLVAAAATGIASKAVAVGASSLLAAAGAGAFAGPIGAAVGIVVGLLSQRLFGHANYAAVANDVASRLKYAEGYKQIAGQYPGRVYGADDLKQVWYGLVHEGLFPKNPASAGWAPGAACNVQACINGVRDSKGNCPGCGGSEGWANDLFTGSLVNQIQGFTGAIRTANQQGIQNPITIADQILIPAWAPPDQGSKNIKWAYPGNSANPSLIRQLFIDTVDAIEYAQNKSLPLFYGSVPSDSGFAPPVAAPLPVAAPPPATVVVSPSCSLPYVWNGTQCVIPSQPSKAPVASSCVAPMVWNGTQCVQPAAAAPTVPTAPPQAIPTQTPIPPGFTVVASDSQGTPIFGSPQGVLYQWNGAQMQLFSGQVSGAASSAAQMQAALQNALAAGQSQQQAVAAALNQAQQAGVAVTPQLQQQVVAQTQATAQAPIQPTAAGVNISGTLGTVAVVGSVLALLFFTARPVGQPTQTRSRRRA